MNREAGIAPRATFPAYEKAKTMVRYPEEWGPIAGSLNEFKDDRRLSRAARSRWQPSHSVGEFVGTLMEQSPTLDVDACWALATLLPSRLAVWWALLMAHDSQRQGDGTIARGHLSAAIRALQAWVQQPTEANHRRLGGYVGPLETAVECCAQAAIQAGYCDGSAWVDSHPYSVAGLVHAVTIKSLSASEAAGKPLSYRQCALLGLKIGRGEMLWSGCLAGATG